MATTAVKLVAAGPTTVIDVPGRVIEGLIVTERQLQFRDTKFWGVDGVSSIYGGFGERLWQVPVIIYDDATVTPLFDTARKLADYIDETLNTTAKGENGTLTIVSESNHADKADCTFMGCRLSPSGIQKDEAGTIGGDYFAIAILIFRQLS